MKKLCKNGSRFKGVRRVRTTSQSRSSDSDENNNGDSIQKQRRTTLKVSFLEIEEKRAGCCYNLKQTFCYKRPTQEELRAFLFSESERFSTFVIKYKKRKQQGLRESGLDSEVSERLTAVSQPLLAYDRTNLNNINMSISPPDSFVVPAAKK